MPGIVQRIISKEYVVGDGDFDIPDLKRKERENKKRLLQVDLRQNISKYTYS
jgi:hypothetical protein